MDALKFAFEILIVGALALPWLAVLIKIFSSADHPADTLESFLAVVPLKARETVGMVVIVAVGYLVGSAVSRISRNLFNDELWGVLPTEDMIRGQVYRGEYCNPDDLLTRLHLPRFLATNYADFRNQMCSPDPKISNEFAREVLRLQEGELLLNGQDKVERLKGFYDQIEVLRGGALNGSILFVLCLFGCCAKVWSEPGRRLLKALALIPATAAAVYGLYSLWGHLVEKRSSLYSKPPLAELVLLMLAGIGIYLLLKAKTKTAQFHFPICIAVALLTVISYYGWWHTEIMYDFQVIHSVQHLSSSVSVP